MLTLDRESIHNRLNRRITAAEWFASGALIVAAFMLTILRPWPYDYLNYLNVAKGNFDHYYYAYWFIPIFQLLARIPIQASYFLWNLINIGALLYAVRVFGGKSFLLLTTFQAFYILIYGQISGIIVGGLALVLWGLANENPWLAGSGILIACTKYQIGAPAALAIWVLYGGSRSIRLKALILPSLISLISLVVYPLWPVSVLETIRNFPPNDWGSITLWRWLGPGALIFGLPPILLHLPRDRRLVAILAAIPLTVPYFQQTDLLLLFAFPLGWLPLAGDIGALYKITGWGMMPFLVIIPLIAYGIAIAPGIKSLLQPIMIHMNKNQIRE